MSDYFNYQSKDVSFCIGIHSKLVTHVQWQCNIHGKM